MVIHVLEVVVRKLVADLMNALRVSDAMMVFVSISVMEVAIAFKDMFASTVSVCLVVVSTQIVDQCKFASKNSAGMFYLCKFFSKPFLTKFGETFLLYYLESLSKLLPETDPK